MPLALIHAEIVSSMPAPCGLFYAHEQELLQMNEENLQQIHNELAEGDKRMDSLTDEVTAIKLEQAQFRVELAENTNATKRIEANTAEMLDVFESWKGAMKVLNWIGKAAKPIGYVVGMGASIAAFWAALKSGVHPK